MTDDRDKLLRVMNSLESDYKSGKISAEKYRYFRSKYEDKLNSIDAMEATMRIRSMQGKPAPNTNQRRSKRPTINKKKQAGKFPACFYVVIRIRTCPDRPGRTTWNRS